MTRARTTCTAAVAVLLALLLASCSFGGADKGSVLPDAERSTTTTVPPVQLSMTPADGSADVPLDAHIGVTATGGTVESVTVLPAGAPEGTPPMGGTMTTGNTGWVSDGTPLAPATTYDVTVAGKNGAGAEVTHTWHFSTLTPVDELHTTVNVTDGNTYGIGMPVVVRFNHTIPDDKKQAVLARLSVESIPAVTGGWRWYNSKEVHYRPQAYWPAHTFVKVHIELAGIDAGDGVWGVDGRTVGFAIGDAHYSLVDANAHMMTVQDNGEVVRSIKVSTGRDKYPTKSGIHVASEKMETHIMDSATVGIPKGSPDYYYEVVKWDVRISNSGEFVHAAPWSVSSQGRANVSHGCVNASTADAQWFYGFSLIGDVVEVVGTSEQLAPDNGYGDWQIPWEQWVNA